MTATQKRDSKVISIVVFSTFISLAAIVTHRNAFPESARCPLYLTFALCCPEVSYQGLLCDPHFGICRQFSVVLSRAPRVAPFIVPLP